jgi:hypothetical protein
MPGRGNDPSTVGRSPRTSTSDGSSIYGRSGFDNLSPIDRVLDRLHKVRRTPSGWSALCPAHDDREPSLSISEGDDGRALLHCHAGCAVDETARAMGIDVRDLFPRPYREVRRSLPPTGRRRRASRALVTLLATGDSGLALTWELAKLVAPKSPERTRHELADLADVFAGSADCVVCDRGDAHGDDRCPYDVGGGALVVAHGLASCLRGRSIFRYCTAKSVNDPDAVRRAVKRSIEELETVSAVPR